MMTPHPEEAPLRRLVGCVFISHGSRRAQERAPHHEAEYSRFTTLLFQLHADALGAVEQPSKMKAGQRVVGMRSDQRGESRHRRGVACLQLRESLGILRRC